MGGLAEGARCASNKLATSLGVRGHHIQPSGELWDGMGAGCTCMQSKRHVCAGTPGPPEGGAWEKGRLLGMENDKCEE